ncbi:MAG: hypothetical protein IJ859_10065 [Synergistaceae bacterium]|nr:hypothetical protein [Synergistaceae bacterium]
MFVIMKCCYSVSVVCEIAYNVNITQQENLIFARSVDNFRTVFILPFAVLNLDV